MRNPLPLARAGWGCALLLAPERVLRLGGRPAPPPALVTAARILGARQVLQALVTARWPTGSVARASAVVDCLHAATDLGYAAVTARQRPIALLDAAIAAGLAAHGWRDRHRPG